MPNNPLYERNTRNFAIFAAMRKYPIGLQDFKEIKGEGFLYVDKTQLIHTLIESGKYYFLSRPRRFGKSLLLSTIKEIFNGRKDLFQGLWIEGNRNWEKKHPVIHLKFSQIAYQQLGLEEAISRELDVIAQELGLAALDADNIKDKFRQLIQKSAADARVVILIDEYDKPIVDYLDDIPQAQQNRSIFKSFYSVLKDADEHIRLLLITGVSKYAKVSIFSDLNNLRDITLSPQFATIAGITQEELEANFAEEIREMQQTNPDILADIKRWYNGYSWNGTDRVYNPFSLLNFMADRIFRNFWFQTGTPTWLVNHIRDHNEFEFENIQMGENILSSFTIENIESITVLFQTGYLTIKSYDPALQLYELDYPNQEVKASLLDYLLSAYNYTSPGKGGLAVTELATAIKANKIEKAVSIISTIFTTIPDLLWSGDKENQFHIVVHLAFTLLGIYVQSEVHNSRGRCDVLLKTSTHIYAFEIKLDGNAEAAVHQITDSGYLEPFLHDKRAKVAVGINFSSEKRKVEDYLVKEI